MEQAFGSNPAGEHLRTANLVRIAWRNLIAVRMCRRSGGDSERRWMQLPGANLPVLVQWHWQLQCLFGDYSSLFAYQP